MKRKENSSQKILSFVVLFGSIILIRNKGNVIFSCNFLISSFLLFGVLSWTFLLRITYCDSIYCCCIWPKRFLMWYESVVATLNSVYNYHCELGWSLFLCCIWFAFVKLRWVSSNSQHQRAICFGTFHIIPIRIIRSLAPRWNFPSHSSGLPLQIHLQRETFLEPESHF